MPAAGAGPSVPRAGPCSALSRLSADVETSSNGLLFFLCFELDSLTTGLLVVFYFARLAAAAGPPRSKRSSLPGRGNSTPPRTRRSSGPTGIECTVRPKELRRHRLVPELVEPSRREQLALSVV